MDKAGVIKVLDKYYNDYLSTQEDTEAFAYALECVKERKVGKWIHKPNEYDDDTWECTECGEPWTLIEGKPSENNMHYCPNCGAKMEGEE